MIIEWVLIIWTTNYQSIERFKGNTHKVTYATEQECRAWERLYKTMNKVDVQFGDKPDIWAKCVRRHKVRMPTVKQG